MGKPIRVTKLKGHPGSSKAKAALPAKPAKPTVTRKVPFQPQPGLHANLAYVLLGLF